MRSRLLHHGTRGTATPSQAPMPTLPRQQRDPKAHERTPRDAPARQRPVETRPAHHPRPPADAGRENIEEPHSARRRPYPGPAPPEGPRPLRPEAGTEANTVFRTPRPAPGPLFNETSRRRIPWSRPRRCGTRKPPASFHRSPRKRGDPPRLTQSLAAYCSVAPQARGSTPYASIQSLAACKVAPQARG